MRSLASSSRFSAATSILALLLSILSLGFQVTRTKPSGPFAKFMGPATISDFQRRMELANLDIVRDRLDFDLRDGMGTPIVVGLSDDQKQVIVRVPLVEMELPKDHETLRTRFLEVGLTAQDFVMLNFNLNEQQRKSAVRVQFWKLAAKNSEGPVYAEFVNGELLFR